MRWRGKKKRTPRQRYAAKMQRLGIGDPRAQAFEKAKALRMGQVDKGEAKWHLDVTESNKKNLIRTLENRARRARTWR